jgi:lipopolysaccharide transport system permease protein
MAMEAIASQQPRDEPITVIEPTGGWKLPSPSGLWAHRDLFYFMLKRDLVVRYKQSVVGAAWAVIQPLLMAGLFAVFLGLLQRVPSEQGIPYSLLAVSGLILWLPLTVALNMGTQSLVVNEQLITKIYFPRLLIPFAAATATALDMVIGVGVVVAIAIIVGEIPDARILAMPVVLLLTVVLAVGLATWFSAINVKYRDIAQAVSFLTLAGFFMSPILYPYEFVLSYLPAWLVPVYALNPMVGLLEAARWSMLGTEIDLRLVLVPVLAAPLLLVTGSLYFQRAERSFADVI